MRLAIISDIHGNLPALEAALASLAAQGVDQYVCLGDVAVFGPQPRECLGRLQTLNCRFIMGNTDAYALQPYPLPHRNEESRFFNEVEAWSATQLTDADRDFISTFAATQTVQLDGDMALLAFHGSPQSFNDAIRPETARATMAEWFSPPQPALLAGGHQHVQFCQPYRDSIFLNPGSVGLPYVSRTGPSRDVNPTYAEFAIITAAQGHLDISLQRAPYALIDLQKAVAANGMPAADWWLADWVQG